MRATVLGREQLEKSQALEQRPAQTSHLSEDQSMSLTLNVRNQCATYNNYSTMHMESSEFILKRYHLPNIESAVRPKLAPACVL